MFSCFLFLPCIIWRVFYAPAIQSARREKNYEMGAILFIRYIT